MLGLAASLGLAPLKSLLGGLPAKVGGPAEAASAPLPRDAPATASAASGARQAARETLWGPDCAMPGGGQELVRLAAVLGLTSAATILLIGAQEGGPARRLATEFGTWVAGMEADPYLLGLAASRAGRGGGAAKRASVEPWTPEAPEFRRAYHHHALALEPLALAEPAPLAAATAAALKPNGQLILLDLVAGDTPAPPEGLARWMALERRRHPPPDAEHVTRALGRAGFDVRVAEDVSTRHQRLCLLGWRSLVARIAQGRPAPTEAAALVAEAETWLWRMRLMRGGHLRLLRWHAIGSARPPVA